MWFCFGLSCQVVEQLFKVKVYMTQTPVLVVGAGPSGLMSALLLTQLGIPVRLIDRKSTPILSTNAAGIQTRTIEVFEHIGIVKEFIDKGIITTGLQMFSQHKRLVKISLSIVDSYFPFILMLPQWHTEKILTKELEDRNIHIERNVELIELIQENGKVISTLKLPDGRQEQIETDWVIGCDGYNSTVRNHANIKMVGKDFDQEFFVADVKLKSQFDRSCINMILNQGKLVGIFALPSENNQLSRLAGNIGRHQNKDKFTDKEIKKMVAEHTQGDCEVTEVIWSAPFWIHSKMAAKLRNGSVFIVGDAAHVHSPAAGQGMNVGLQDAFNLTWKLAMVIKKQADPSILDSYQQERLPLIKNVLRLTETLGFFGLSTSYLLYRIRNFIFKNVAGKVKPLQKKMAGIMTQVGLRYKKSSLIDKTSRRSSTGPKPGARMPDVIAPNHRLYDYLRGPKFHVLLFVGSNPTKENIDKAVAASKQLIENIGSLVIPHIISNKACDVPHFIDDVDLAIHKRYGVNEPSMCLIRPDQYIAQFVDGLDANVIKAFLKKCGFIVA